MTDELTPEEKAALEKLIDDNPEGDKSGDYNSLSANKTDRGGVLKGLLSPEQKEENYLATLLTGNFVDDEEGNRVIGAIAEALRYNLSLAPILSYVNAMAAVNNKSKRGRVQMAIDGLTRTQIDTRHYGKERLTGKQKSEMEDN